MLQFFMTKVVTEKKIKCKESFRVKLPAKGEKEMKLKELNDIIRLIIFFIFLFSVSSFFSPFFVYVTVGNVGILNVE